MTKDEIKFYKEQQKRVEDCLYYRINSLESQVIERDEIIQDLSRKNAELRGQIATLQSSLTGEEVEYLESR